MRVPSHNHHERQQPSAPEDLHAHYAWIRGHWAFFVLIQAAIINLIRLKLALDRHDSAKAIRLFEQTSALMLGSAVAMRIAGDVNPKSYQESLIPSMKAARPKFSGSDSSDHAELIRCYQALTAPLALLDTKLTPAYLRFVASVRTAKEAHKYVCGEHGGNDRPSTGSGCRTELSGVETLEKLGIHREGMLTPGTGPSRCPFHS
jgi:hypothetical protein